ncbi:MAG: hypothetical protein J5841_00995 [Clostridia bacterium]|nr:hypothetical protein [Clostridia bacterium]
MKKIISLVLALCLVFALASEAFAAGKPTITKQPETSTTSKKGAVSFSISVKGTVDSYTWYFINPETGEKVSGKKLSSVFKDIKVNSPNSKKISLTHVPDAMHGWSVYCHVNGNGYKVDSDTVMLLVYGLEPPAGASAPAAAPADTTPAENTAPAPETADTANGKPTDDNSRKPDDGSDEAMPELELKTITVSASSKVLLKLDSVGNVVEGDPVSKLTFDNTGSFLVRSENPIKSWTVNGIRFEPASPVNEFKVMNITEDVALDFKIVRQTAASAEVDASHMCKVSCTGCTFTYHSGGLRSVTEGEVPAGAPIKVIADSSALAANGYSINGGEKEYAGKASFQLTVTEDTTIVVGK